MEGRWCVFYTWSRISISQPSGTQMRRNASFTTSPVIGEMKHVVCKRSFSSRPNKLRTFSENQSSKSGRVSSASVTQAASDCCCPQRHSMQQCTSTGLPMWSVCKCIDTRPAPWQRGQSWAATGGGAGATRCSLLNMIVAQIAQRRKGQGRVWVGRNEEGGPIISGERRRETTRPDSPKLQGPQALPT